MELRRTRLLEHQFDVTPTVPIIIFEILVIAAVICLLFVISRYIKKVLLRFVVISLGILVFEFFTSPMWLNYRMGEWAYVYQDVSWILTIGWSIMVLSTIVFVDKIFPSLKEWKRFGIYLVVLTILVLIFESVVVRLGIRSYPPEVQAVTYGYFPFGAPVGALYYVPVFMALIIGFYKYWNFMIEGKALIPVKRRRWFQGLGITFIAMLLFEIMIDPMADNVGFPRWSYIYRDISILLVCVWVIIVWLTINLVDKVLIDKGLLKKFVGYLAVIFCIVLPIESWLMLSGHVVFSSTTRAGFSGFLIPLVNIPVEIAFAIPFYYALVVAFIKYWEILLYNRRLQ